jgi:hypothetical protein
MADHAVVIGITRYPDLGNLQGPELDAIDFAAWLQHQAAEPLPAANIRLVVTSKYPEDPKKPTTEQVDEAFTQIVDLPRGESGVAGRRLYIYMAGHGFSPTLEDAALLMANAARGKTGFHIPGRPYANWFRRARLFDEVVLFMDCCRENHSRAPLKNPPWDEQTSAAAARACYGFATDWSRAAREGPVGNPPAIRGKFTVALLEGLRGAAANPHTRSITGTSLKEFVFNALTKNAAAGAEFQEPKFDVDDRDDVVFNVAAPPPYTVRVTGADAEQAILQDGSLTPIAPSRKEAGLAEWKVYRGLYLLIRGALTMPLQLVDAGGLVNV